MTNLLEVLNVYIEVYIEVTFFWIVKEVAPAISDVLLNNFSFVYQARDSSVVVLNLKSYLQTSW